MPHQAIALLAFLRGLLQETFSFRARRFKFVGAGGRAVGGWVGLRRDLSLLGLFLCSGFPFPNPFGYLRPPLTAPSSACLPQSPALRSPGLFAAARRLSECVPRAVCARTVVGRCIVGAFVSLPLRPQTSLHPAPLRLDLLSCCSSECLPGVVRGFFGFLWVCVSVPCECPAFPSPPDPGASGFAGSRAASTSSEGP